MKKESVVLLTIGVALVMTLVGGCSATGESTVISSSVFAGIDRVAVIDVTGNVQGDTAKNQIGDFFGMELLKKGITPVERAQVMALLTEQQFQGMEVSSSQGVARAGQILNVPAVLIANVDYGEQMNMTAKIIKVEDGATIWIGSGFGKTGKGLNPLVGAATGALFGGIVAGSDRTGRAIGAVGGGVLGGVAGEALTPQQAQLCQKVIKKMCASLPSRVGVQ